MTRKLMMALLATLCAASAAFAYDPSYNGYSPNTGVVGTPHDLAQTGHGMVNYNTADPLDRVCIYCHAPHNTYRLSTADTVGAGPVAPDEYTYLPLWNHQVTDLDFTMYQNGPGAPQSGPKASQAIDQNLTGPGPTSLLCLSCHDGSVAVNSYGNSAQLAHSQQTGTTFMNLRYAIGAGGYLGNHHPIGFIYGDVAGADPEIVVAASASLGTAGTVADHLYGDGRMECGTCHSVHNKGNEGETLLWKSDRASALCLTCHVK